MRTVAMRTVVLGERPAELQALIDRRRALGLDGHDEVWEGEYHLAPHAHSRHGLVEAEVLAALRSRARRRGWRVTGTFNLGEIDDFRVPMTSGFRTAASTDGRRRRCTSTRRRSPWRCCRRTTRRTRSSDSTAATASTSCWWPTR